jgi:predicted nucleic acid-binding protein
MALLDTNVILDLLLKRAPFATAAAELWEACRAGRVSGFMSAIAPTTIYYIGRRQVGADAARQGVADVLAVLGVCPVDAAVLSAALALPMADYEDAIQHASATAAGVAAIVTRDPADFAGATLPVFSPTDFLAQLPAPGAGQP